MKRTSSITVALIVALGAFLVGGCSPEPDTKMGSTTPSETKPRITVTRIGVMEDDLAYANRRGIYIITDAKTHTEYVGISGIGISELGLHVVGKAVVPDER
jgi:hypothetical protein